MHISTRLLRAHADSLSNGPPPPTDREREREDRIVAVALPLLAHHGRAALTMAKLATALRMGVGSIRRHFVDMDELLGDILLRHLRAIVEAIGRIPPDLPGLKAAQRAAYLATTRTAAGALTDPHLLLIRERHTLPPDLQAAVEQLRQTLGDIFAGSNGAIALALLDSPDLQATQIEAMLNALDPPAAATTPQPAPPAARPAAQAPTPKHPNPNWTYPRKFPPSHQSRAGPT